MRPAGGWGVVEFMIAIALGLLLSLLAAGLLMATASNYRNHSDNVWVGDGGRYALAVMAQSLRQSSYVNWDSDGAPPALDTPSVTGLNAASISRTTDGISVPLPAVANGSDVLAVRFSGSDDGASVNCAGFAVPADTRGWSIFYVAADTGGEPELRCKYRSTSGWGADALVRGVDSFQVLYGVDTDVPMDGVPNSYLNAAAVQAADAWKRVCGVKLALLLHGETNTRADTVDMRFDLFGAAYADTHPGDVGVRIVESKLPEAERLRARRVFSMTVALRNRDG